MSRWGRRRRTINSPWAEKLRLEKLMLKTERGYARNIFGPISPFTNTSEGIQKIIRYTPDAIKAKSFFVPMFSEVMKNFIEGKISDKEKVTYGSTTYTNPHSLKYLYLIQSAEKYINDSTKVELSDLFVKHYRNFNSGAKKELAAMAARFIGDDYTRAPDIISAFYRNLRPRDFEQLVDKLPDKYENPTVKTVLGKTKMFEYLKYSEEAIKDPKVKSELVKAIARTPTLVKRITYPVHVTKDDIKAIAPAMRFKFLQFAYETEIRFSGYYAYYGERLKRTVEYNKARKKTSALVMPVLPPEELEELCFAVSLQKNDEFFKWSEGYRKFYKCYHSNEPLARI